jgi:hypothetical protein
MSLSEEEINELKCILSQEKVFSRRAIRQLIPFVCTYLGGTGFTNYAGTIQTQKQTRCGALFEY